MKRKWWFAEILIGVYLTLAIFGIGYGVSWSLQPSHPPAQQQATDQHGTAKPEGKGGESFWEATVSDPVAFFTLWIAVFTVVLGVSTILLWRETANAGKLASKLHASEQRPWLSLTLNKAIQTWSGDIAQANIELAALNVGKTPAIGVRFESKLIRALPTIDAAFDEFVSSKLAGYRKAEAGEDALAKRRGVVFPGGSAVIGPMDRTEEDIPKPGLIVPHYHLLCCLLYKSPDGSTVLHTATVYHLEFKIIGNNAKMAFPGRSYPAGAEIIAFNLMGINSAT